MPKSVDISLDGDSYSLTYDLNALAKVEERTGQSFGELFPDNDEEAPSMMDVRTVLWAGLHRDNPDLTEEDVGAMIGPSDFERVFNKLQDAFEEALDGGDEEALGKPNNGAVSKSPSASPR